jgi:hypothetical protein
MIDRKSREFPLQAVQIDLHLVVAVMLCCHECAPLLLCLRSRQRQWSNEVRTPVDVGLNNNEFAMVSPLTTAPRRNGPRPPRSADDAAIAVKIQAREPTEGNFVHT